MVLHEVVDHRGESGLGGTQHGQQLVVLTRVVSVNRGTEAEAVRAEILAQGPRHGIPAAVRDRLPQRGKAFPHRLVNLGELLAQRDHAIMRSQEKG